MKRTILSVAYPLTEVGPNAVGGSEQILTILDRVVTEAGHRSIVIAAKGSKVTGTLIPSPKAPRTLTPAAREEGVGAHRELISKVLGRYDVDLVHMHSLDFHRYIPRERVPVLATLHLPPEWYPQEIFDLNRRDLRLNCVSWSQHERCPESDLLVEPIANGVNVDGLASRARKKDFVMAMGRICPEKGFHFALDAARETGTEMVLGGQVFPYPSHLSYFRTEIKPRLDKHRRFIGALNFRRKKQLLSQARCLIIPSTVAETSSLVAMEALACGTPVIAFRSGALPEIVEDGKTGFIVSSTRGIIAALRKIDRIDPEACRAAARSRFSLETMGARYLKIYDHMINRRKMPRLYVNAA